LCFLNFSADMWITPGLTCSLYQVCDRTPFLQRCGEIWPLLVADSSG
jgi:hypothetical protein